MTTYKKKQYLNFWKNKVVNKNQLMREQIFYYFLESLNVFSLN